MTTPAARPKVLVAGAGVAGLEAVLALRASLGRTVDIAMLAPDREFVYRPTSVAEPFEMGEAHRFDLQKICWDQGVELVTGALASVDAAGHAVGTGDGQAIGYDFLVVAVGTTQRDDLPGAITFHGPGDVSAVRSVLTDVEAGTAASVAFVVPPESAWALPVYELALLTEKHLRERAASGARLIIVTPEREPLGLFGSRASEAVRRLLDERGIELETNCYATGTEPGGALLVRPSGWIEADRVVTLPSLDGPRVAGLPASSRGFIAVDERCAVRGAPDVWAAGDATTFPIKQGGIASQQADLVAAAIAARITGDAEPPPFRPLLRGLLATGSAPEYMTAERDEDLHSETRGVARHPLWDPPGKIAARHLAPYLASLGGDRLDPPGRLSEIEEGEGPDAEVATEHDAATELALAMAEADAGWKDYDAALKWLDTAERLEVVLPPEYAEKRRQWEEARDVNPEYGGTPSGR